MLLECGDHVLSELAIIAPIILRRRLARKPKFNPLERSPLGLE